MRYHFDDLADKPNEFIFLEGWVNPEDKGLYFQHGNREAWFRQHLKGYKFVGKTKTICVYPPPYGLERGLNHHVAKQMAIAYATGNYIRIDIELVHRE